jgi:hypothetical protein
MGFTKCAEFLSGGMICTKFHDNRLGHYKEHYCYFRKNLGAIIFALLANGICQVSISDVFMRHDIYTKIHDNSDKGVQAT